MNVGNKNTNKGKSPFHIPDEYANFPPGNSLIARILRWAHKNCDCHYGKMGDYIPQLVRDVNDGKTILFSFKYKDKFQENEYPPHVLLHLQQLGKVCHAKVNEDLDYILDPSSFVRPINKDVTLWRYQDISKFKDLIDTEELHLSNMDVLDDKLEGKPTRSFRNMINTVDEYRRSEKMSLSDKIMFLLEAGSAYNYEDLLDALPKNGYVSCWHASDQESPFMWENYTSRPESVAIRTNVGSIRESIQGKKTDIYEVHYVDYEHQDRVLPTPYIHMLTHKDRKYSNEKEYRILQIDNVNPFSSESTQREEHKRIPIDIPNFIQEIRVHPKASIDTLYKIRRLVNYKFPNIRVLPSKYRYRRQFMKKEDPLDKHMKSRRLMLGKRSKMPTDLDLT